MFRIKMVMKMIGKRLEREVRARWCNGNGWRRIGHTGGVVDLVTGAHDACMEGRRVRMRF